MAAKQIAHNAINGYDDQSTLREIAKLIDDVDDMLESYIGKDILEEPMAELEKLIAPKVEFDWRNVTFTFLPHQLQDLDKLVSVLQSMNPDTIGVAPIEEHKPFVEAITKFQSFANVKNTGAAIQEWVQLTSVFGSPAIPSEASNVISEALKKMEERGEIGKKNRWQALEYWAASYLAEG